MRRLLQRGIELIQMLRADLQHLGARNLHELLRCWELWHRTWVGRPICGTCSTARKPAGLAITTAPIIPALDDANWRVFVNSRYHAANDPWELFTRPYINLVT